MVGILLAWSVGCTGETPPPPTPPPAPPPAPDRDRDREKSKKGAGSDADEIVERWTPFLKKEFGAEPKGGWRLDFDADDKDEVVVRIAKKLVVAQAGPGPEPHGLKVLELSADKEVTVRERGWAVDAVPALGEHLAPRASVLVVGDEAPVILFRDKKADSYAWTQMIPKKMDPWVEAAKKEHPDAFTFGKNNLLGKRGREAEGEQPLTQAFVGDFDADGKPELLVIDGQRSYRYSDGADAPRFESIGIDAHRGTLVSARGKFESPHEKEPLDLDRDAIRLWIPNGDGGIWFWKDEKWNEFKVAD